MIQRDLDEILEAATSIKLVGRVMSEMELDKVEKGTCALIINQAVSVIFECLEKLEEGSRTSL
jgi:hypothetical protein